MEMLECSGPSIASQAYSDASSKSAYTRQSVSYMCSPEFSTSEHLYSQLLAEKFSVSSCRIYHTAICIVLVNNADNQKYRTKFSDMLKPVAGKRAIYNRPTITYNSAVFFSALCT